MSLLRIPRVLYIRTTNLTHGYQGMDRRLVAFYRAWSKVYDVTVGLDPAYRREMQTMIDGVVSQGDMVLDLGAGTGLGTMHAAGKAEHVVAIDLSPDMIARLQRKAGRRRIKNVEAIVGSFPEDLPGRRRFDVVFSSFAIVHWPQEARGELYRRVYSLLKPGGRIGLFSAQGEVASAFETRTELEANLESAGFVGLEVADVADIYRTVTARRPAGEAEGEPASG